MTRPIRAAALAALLGLGCSDPSSFLPPMCSFANEPTPGPNHSSDGPGAVFAVTALFLGDLDRDGTPDRDGWKHLGLDIDGVSDDCVGSACKEVKHHCRPAAGGSPAAAFPDGDCGIDNSFGLNLLPLLLMDFPWPENVNQHLVAGDFTLLFAIDGLSKDSSSNPLAARLYRGAVLGHAPRFGSLEAWPVTRDSVSDPDDVNSSIFPFPKSFVVDDTWVSGVGELSIRLPFHGQPLDLTLHHAIATMLLSADRRSAKNGTIAGVLDVSAISAEVPRLVFADGVSTACNDSTVKSIQDLVHQVSDIMTDGTAGTSDETCDGISVGLGFEARAVKLGKVVDDPPPPDPCPP